MTSTPKEDSESSEEVTGHKKKYKDFAFLKAMIQDPQADEIDLTVLLESMDFDTLNGRIQKLVLKQKRNGCLSMVEGVELKRLVKHK